MCADPLTLTLIGSTLFSAATTAVQGYNAATVSRYNARQEQNASLQQEALLREQSGRRISEQALTLANSGARLDSDTPLLLLGESARNSALDALAVRQTGQAKAASLRMQADNQFQAGLFGAGAQILGGAVKLQELGRINPPAPANDIPMVTATPMNAAFR